MIPKSTALSRFGQIVRAYCKKDKIEAKIQVGDEAVFLGIFYFSMLQNIGMFLYNINVLNNNLKVLQL